jgi:hypothetical protein
MDKFRDLTFKNTIFPELVFHYRREELKELERKCPWLKPFRFARPDLDKARDHFFKDGTEFINNLNSHWNLVRLAAVNEEMSKRYGDPYTIFMAEFYEKVESLTDLSIGDSEDSKLKRERNEITERSKSNSLVASFMHAAEEMRVESKNPSIVNR